jgi:hypothetical protein
LTELGKGVFTIKLGKLTLDSEVIIAEIEDDALVYCLESRTNSQPPL